MLALGVVFLLWRYPRSQPVEILLPTATPMAGQVYVGGAVSSPGFYPWPPEATLEQIIRNAGGPLGEANLEGIRVTVPAQAEEPSPQRININTAPEWLLEALPGVGPTLAQAIISYRTEKGPFQRPEEISRVPGIGPEMLKKVKELITVGD